MKANKYLTATQYKDSIMIPVFLVIHHTGSLKDMSNYLSHPGDGRAVSVHWHINRDGVLTEYSNLVSLEHGWAKIAWHAGQSGFELSGKRYSGLNSCALGIELDGDGDAEFNEKQMGKLYELTPEIISVFNIEIAAIVGHKEISPGRKIDPRPFDMGLFRDRHRSDESGTDKAETESIKAALHNMYHGPGVLAKGVDQDTKKAANEIMRFAKKRWGIED